VAIPGTILAGTYLLAEPLGSGGMGTVHRAEDLLLGRPVAIKFLHHLLARDPRVAARFQVEALAAARLDHPNTVAVLDHGETDDGIPFLVMEYVRGTTLRQLLVDGGLASDRVIPIVRQILGALGTAHAAGVVHADVKTENVLVEMPGEHIKLVDFGLARVGLAAVPSSRDARDEPFVAGTPEYMAPEIILGAPPSPSSDIYAAGILLHELLTGATPYGGGRAVDIFTRHVQDELVPPSVRFPDLDIPRALEVVLARALAKDADHRFHDAGAFADALAAVESCCVPVLPPHGVVAYAINAGDITHNVRRRAS
jgi:serine/threonine-protein kinase